MIPLKLREAAKIIIEAARRTFGAPGLSGVDKEIVHAYRLIQNASLGDLTAITVSDVKKIQGLRVVIWVAGDCGVFTDDKKTELFSHILDIATFYWKHNPDLPNPFPRNKFTQPDITCDDEGGTTISFLIDHICTEWEGAQDA